MGGDAMMKASRKPDIMADAAYWILTQKSTQCTGNFFVDEDLLRKIGVKDFEHYANVPGEKLGLDFFLPDEDVQVDFTKDQTIFSKKSKL
jgi:citronellol/citronellal dehydrogenase